MGSCVLYMRPDVARPEKALSLSVAEHGVQALIHVRCHVTSDASHMEHGGVGHGAGVVGGSGVVWPVGGWGCLAVGWCGVCGAWCCLTDVGSEAVRLVGGGAEDGDVSRGTSLSRAWCWYCRWFWLAPRVGGRGCLAVGWCGLSGVGLRTATFHVEHRCLGHGAGIAAGSGWLPGSGAGAVWLWGGAACRGWG